MDIEKIKEKIKDSQSMAQTKKRLTTEELVTLLLIDMPSDEPVTEEDVELIAQVLEKVKTLSEARRKAIKARLKAYSLDDFKILFEKAEASSFLKGSNERNWSATFDWLIKDSNMAKVIDGNYDNKGKSQSEKRDSGANKNKFNSFPQRKYDMEALEQALLNTTERGNEEGES